ncbi:hypothetical protein [Nocardioides pyridinolyticus]
MTWIDHGRRAVTVLLVALALLTVPAVARAGFSDRQTGSLSTSTARLVAPTGVTGTWQCVGGFSSEGFDATVSSFVDNGPAGASYRYSLLRGTTVVKTATSTSRSATISSGNLSSDRATTQWTLSIQAVLGPWTGPTYTRTVSCANMSNASGAL